MAKLERDLSTPELRAWWDRVKEIANDAPRLNIRGDSDQSAPLAQYYAKNASVQALRWFRGSEPYPVDLADVLEPFFKDAIMQAREE